MASSENLSGNESEPAKGGGMLVDRDTLVLNRIHIYLKPVQSLYQRFLGMERV